MKTSVLNLLIAVLALLALLIAHSVSAQSEPTPDCRALSIQAADEIADGMLQMNMRNVKDAIQKTTTSCGISELSLRMTIIARLVKHESVEDELKVYFENGYHHRTVSRINNSAVLDFGYRYQQSDDTYSFVPLRHRVDSISGKVAEDLLASQRLNEDEVLVCTLFSGDVAGFHQKYYSAGKNSFVGSYRQNEERTSSRGRIALVVSYGQYVPFGDRNVLTSSPVIGFAFCSPIEYKLSFEFGLKIRFLNGDSTFKYDALGQINDVDPEDGVFVGLTTGYKLYDKKNFIVQSRFGLGIESIDTGIAKESNQNSNDSSTESYYLETVHSSVGLSFMKGVGKKKYLGAAVDLHLTPYGFDKRLKTKLDNTAVSAELFLRL